MATVEFSRMQQSNALNRSNNIDCSIHAYPVPVNKKQGTICPRSTVLFYIVIITSFIESMSYLKIIIYIWFQMLQVTPNTYCCGFEQAVTVEFKNAADWNL